MAKGKGGSGNGRSQMTVTAASRIQSATAKTNGGDVPKGSFASRSQSAAAANGSTVKK
jgi:hypothetical protein